MVVIYKYLNFKLKITRYKRFFIFSIILLLIGVFLGFKYSYKLKPILSYLNINKKANIITEESLINEVKSVNKLIPLEIELSQNIIIDKSFYNLDVFKKSKNITFFATCSYSIDFSNISTKDLILDNTNKHITILVPPPEVFSINIDESKTKYSEPELGLLRFGDIQLSSEEFGELRNQLYTDFENKMKDKSLHDEAILNTKISLQKLITNLIGESYIIDIKLK